LEQILTHSLLKGIEVGLKLFLIYTLKILVGSLWKQRTYTLQLLFGALWRQSTYILQLLLAPIESKVLTHCSCYWGPFESVVHWFLFQLSVFV